MFKWKEDFVGNTQKKCVYVNHNGDFDHGKVLYLEPDWSYFELLNAASHRLNMFPAAKRLFNADGVEIDDCMMIEDDDILFLSIVDDFIAPNAHYNDAGPGDSRKINGATEADKIPHSIGGYKVGDILGRGGFGVVCVGEHQLTGERVALKFLKKSEIQSLGAAERTNTEIQCLTALKHMNIIRLQQHVESVNHVVLVFELMDGGDLLKYLQKQKNGVNKKACLPEDEARHIFYQVLSAVSYAHNQHICHRDLKLENILLKDLSTAVVKIADFGLSDFYRPGATMKTNCGTLSFLAPEVFKGTSNAGPPLDVWSLGVILFAILCGRLPFEGPDLIGTKRPRDAVIKSRILKCQYKIDEQLGSEAKDLVRRILQVDPAERATLPEIFNHVWVRSATSSHYSDSYHFNNMIKTLGNSDMLDGASPHIVGKNRRTISNKINEESGLRIGSVESDVAIEPSSAITAQSNVATGSLNSTISMMDKLKNDGANLHSNGTINLRKSFVLDSMLSSLTLGDSMLPGNGSPNVVRDRTGSRDQRDRSPLKSNARLLMSSEASNSITNNAQQNSESKEDGRPGSSNNNHNIRNHTGLHLSTISSSGSGSNDDDSSHIIDGIFSSYSHGSGPNSGGKTPSTGSSPPFQSPIFKLVPLRRMGTAVKENDDDDDITPSMAHFRSSTLPLDFSSSGSSISSSKSRPNTVSTLVSSSKRNGLLSSKEKGGVDIDIDDSMSCGSSPGMERLHYNSRFVTATSTLHPPPSHSVSASGSRKTSNYNGQHSGKLSLNTNIFHDNGTGNSTRGETKDAGYSYNTSSNKRQSIPDPIVSPSGATNNVLKKEMNFGDPTHPTISTPSSRGRSSTVIGHSRFRFPT
mmetsp:Transcript_11556/g.15906  ORF Transcript_11556/g.15906 Transcript_11556/m.15906 type:complete len:863 (+) Transcript_11556:156-2744(+)|eukprot:CAMPEP_0170063400 /NCGR_PEP_ID=MMETSP0019_2-20121128/4281_1 /TAXON_ID=98059 /ORGANISM="Dinobryon sp., Strain UTEXLB2267" /LENGTH=862 /DNA_ID=CAMNT_0010269819 /DNA_START=70 /DNA_END=2658 /DNA_ORIENTATION=-